MTRGEGFVPIARLADLPPGSALGTEIGGLPVAVFNVAGELYALEDVCSHAGARLSEGALTGTEVTCPWHFACFDVTSGEPRGGPAFTAVRTCEVRVVDGEVQVRPPAEEGPGEA